MNASGEPLVWFIMRIWWCCYIVVWKIKWWWRHRL